MPVLSVIVPVYNAERTIRRCVDSILNQRFSDIELIIVDDGSTDGSSSLCREYARLDDRVRVVHKGNGGMGSARNVGIKDAKGSYITFVDADDYISEDAYSDNLPLMGKVSVLQYPVERIRNGQKVGMRRFATNETVSGREELYIAWLRLHSIGNYFCNKIFRRELFDHIEFREDMLFEDRYLTCDLLNQCKEMLLSEKGTYYYTYTEGHITSLPETDFVLKSKLIADLHIAENTKQMKALRTEYLNRYYNSVAYLKKIEQKQLRTTLAIQVEKQLPAIMHIVFAKVPIGIKFQLLLYWIKNITNN